MDRRVEITGPTDRKMVINALNCGANVFMADFEDANTPTWDNLIEGQINLSDAIKRQHQLRRSRHRPALQAQRRDRDLAGAAARLASAGAARAGRRRADVGRLLRFRPLLLPQREAAARQGQRPLFLPAEDGEPSGGAALERRFRSRAGEARRPQGLDQGDGADRDHHGRLRDGRDPARAARAFRRPQLRALGLHLQLHQEIRRGSPCGDAGSRPGHHDQRISCAPTACC